MTITIEILISAGQGPKECGWVVAQLAKKIDAAAKQSALRCARSQAVAFDKALRKQTLIEADAYRSMVLSISGSGAEGFAANWLGTIKWQGQSPYRQQHKRNNWFAQVSRITTMRAETLLLSKLLQQVRFQCVQASGPGGQHVNKTASAVQLLHVPTGIRLKVSTQRSQHQNKQIALRRLQQILMQQQQKASAQQTEQQWLSHYQVPRGTTNSQPIVRTYSGYEFSEI